MIMELRSFQLLPLSRLESVAFLSPLTFFDRTVIITLSYGITQFSICNSYSYSSVTRTSQHEWLLYNYYVGKRIDCHSIPNDYYHKSFKRTVFSSHKLSSTFFTTKSKASFVHQRRMSKYSLTHSHGTFRTCQNTHQNYSSVQLTLYIIAEKMIIQPQVRKDQNGKVKK
jgi:hypothetical protein